MPVFISHSNKDEALYTHLCNALDNASIPRWDITSTLLPGSSLADQLRYTIEQCEVCVFLATRTSLDTPWCHAELGAFWGAGKKVIVYLEDAQLREHELPPQFSGNLWAKNLSELIKGLRAALKPETPKPQESIIIMKDIKGIKTDTSIFCVTYKPNKNRDPFAQPWLIDKKFKVPTSLDRLVLEKAMILDHLENPTCPYKLYLLVNKNQKNKFINYLLNGNCTITGKGEQDNEDLNKWRIWFLVDGEPIHPNLKTAALLNHTLMFT